MRKRIALWTLGFLALFGAIGNIIFRSMDVNDKKWDLYPEFQDSSKKEKYGIIMAGTSNKFPTRGGVENYVGPCIAKLYSQKHDYAFKLVTNLEDVDHRTYGSCGTFSQWNKIKLMQKYITDVDILLWVDLDAVISQFNKRLEEVLPNYMPGSACNSYSDIRELGKNITTRKQSDLPGASPEPFFWATLDINPSYSVNLNTAVMGMRRGSLANAFLEGVWNAGEDPHAFKRHDNYWTKKKPCKGYFGWPWEQGGIWDMLANTSQAEFLRATCVLPRIGPTALNSIMDYWEGGPVHPGRPFITHKPDISMKKVLWSFMESFNIESADIHSQCDPRLRHFLPPK